MVAAVEEWIAADPALDRHALAAAEAPAAVPEHFDFNRFQVNAPLAGDEAGSIQEPAGSYGERPQVAMRRDYAAREAQNASLGRAGEELVVRFEQHRLSSAGLHELARKVEHVSRTQGDGLGFDILSFDERGNERFVEVKTTTFARETPFFASASEVRFAERNSDRFALCRVFEFKKGPRCFVLQGPIHRHCAMDPFSYRCSIR